MVSSKYPSPLMDNFLDKYNQYEIDGLLFKIYGSTDETLIIELILTVTIDRQQSLNRYRQDLLKKLKEQHELKLWRRGGNAYTLPYVEQLVKAPFQFWSYYY